MKCIAVVVMVALAVAVEAGVHSIHGVVPSVYAAETVVQQNVVPRYVTAYSAPAVTYASHGIAPVAAYAAHAHAPVAYAAHNTVVEAPLAYSAPIAYAHDHHSYVHAVPTVYAPVHKEASYVAATRGAVHHAPLPGHAINQKSLNVEPAPGTL